MAVTNLHRRTSGAKRVLPSWAWTRVRAVGTAVLTPVRFSLRTGHWRSSLRSAACTAAGEPTPWYTYPAIDFLSQRSFAGRSILEFGGGQSTLWWARRAQSVLTIEEDEAWYSDLRRHISGNVELHHVPVSRETRSIEAIEDLLRSRPDKKYDIIIVDGHLRPELAALAYDYVAEGGAILLDDAEGYGFYDVTSARPGQRVDFYGFAPGVPLRHCTSLVFMRDCFLFDGKVPISTIEAT